MAWRRATLPTTPRRSLHLVPPVALQHWVRVQPRQLLAHGNDANVVMVVDAAPASAPYARRALVLKLVLDARDTQREDAMLRRVQALRDGLPLHLLRGASGVVRFLGSQHGVPWRRATAIAIAMEHVAGPSLFDIVSSARQPLASCDVAHYGGQVAAALAFLHRHGVAHRDVKPENVVVEARTGRCVLVDFGFACPTGACDTFPGSPEYAAPELFVGATYDAAAADAYSFGVVLHVLATLRPLFTRADGESLHDMGLRVVRDKPDLTGLARPVAQLVARLLDKTPGARPSMAAVAAHKFFSSK